MLTKIYAIKPIIFGVSLIALNYALDVLLFIKNKTMDLIKYLLIFALSAKITNIYTGNVILDILIMLNVPYKHIKSRTHHNTIDLFDSQSYYDDNHNMKLNFKEDEITYKGKSYEILFNSIIFTIEDIRDQIAIDEINLDNMDDIIIE